jgi:MFS family permease
LYNTFYFVGGILAAWTTYATFKMSSNWGWRIPSIMQGAFPLFQLIGFFFLPESPRWLVAQGRVQEARAFLVRFHTDSDETSPLVDFEMSEIEENIELERHVNSQSSYLDLFRGAPNRRRSLIAAILAIFTQWSGNAVISYYLTLVLNTIGITQTSSQTLINGMLQIFNWFCAVCGGALLVDKLGRRTLFLTSASIMFMSYICWTILNSVFTANHNIQAGHAVSLSTQRQDVVLTQY